MSNVIRLAAFVLLIAFTIVPYTTSTGRLTYAPIFYPPRKWGWDDDIGARSRRTAELTTPEGYTVDPRHPRYSSDLKLRFRELHGMLPETEWNRQLDQMLEDDFARADAATPLSGRSIRLTEADPRATVDRFRYKIQLGAAVTVVGMFVAAAGLSSRTRRR